MDVEHLGWSVMLWYCVLLLIQAAFWYLLVRIDGLKVRRHSSKPSSDLHTSDSHTSSWRLCLLTGSSKPSFHIHFIVAFVSGSLRRSATFGG